MAYECVMCPEGERARFVFIDTEDGQTAAACEGHVFDFLMAMTAYAAQALGVDVNVEDLGGQVANGTTPEQEPAIDADPDLIVADRAEHVTSDESQAWPYTKEVKRRSPRKRAAPVTAEPEQPEPATTE